MSRKNTPDIMSNLMTGATINTEIEQEVIPAIKHENNKTIIANNSIPSKNMNHKETNAENIKVINATIPIKERTTFNLSQETLEILEDAWMKLRKKLKGELRITKTLIVEKAIAMAIDDLESKSELGELYKRLKQG